MAASSSTTHPCEPAEAGDQPKPGWLLAAATLGHCWLQICGKAVASRGIVLTDAAALGADVQDNTPQPRQGIDREALRAEESWASYLAFVAEPKHKCGTCWLMKQHCCCAGLRRSPPPLRPKVVVAFHYSELGRHLGSNTAKLLLHYGAELLAWGVEQHNKRLQNMIAEDPAGMMVLFPGPGAVTGRDVAARRGRLQPNSEPRCIIVLDGGWRECKRINEFIDPSILRCVVTTATREEYGGTRKYGKSGDQDGSRVQTAAAFVALMQELEEDPDHVAMLKADLAHFMSCWEAQIRRSKTHVS